MANANLPRGFTLFSNDAIVIKYLAADGESLAAGDTVYMNSAGYAGDTATDPTLGVAMSDIIDGYTGAINATAASASYDYIYVNININSIYTAQISTGALTSPYTTRSAAAAYDEAGDSGVQYINAAASDNDTWRCVGYATEYKEGAESVAGVYQKVYCKLNPLECILGTIA